MGLRPGPRRGSLQRSPRPPSRWGRGWLPNPQNPTPLISVPMQTVCNTHWDARRGKSGGTYARKPNPSAASLRRGLAAPPQVLALRASPLLSPTPKLVPTPLVVLIYTFTYWPFVKPFQLHVCITVTPLKVLSIVIWLKFEFGHHHLKRDIDEIKEKNTIF